MSAFDRVPIRRMTQLSAQGASEIQLIKSALGRERTFSDIWSAHLGVGDMTISFYRLPRGE